MSKKNRIPDLFLGALLAVAIFALGIGFESSRRAPSDNNSSQGAEHGSAPDASNKSPDKLTDWLLVIFNGLLFGSTVLLWNATARSSKIAERALTELERPFITVEVINSGLTFSLSGGLTSPISDFEHQFINHGRTPAELIELVETWPVVDRIKDPSDANKFKPALPDPIDPHVQRGRKLPVGVVVSPIKPYELSANAFAVIEIQRLNTRGWYESGGTDLFFCGYVRYRDIFGSRYILGFCAIYGTRSGKFVLMGDSRYNYTRQEASED